LNVLAIIWLANLASTKMRSYTRGFGNNLSVLAIIWLANLASTKIRSFIRVAVSRRAIKKSSFTFSCDGFYFCANFEIIATSPVVRMHFIAAHYFGFWRLDPIE
jgi:hypothetical protein